MRILGWLFVALGLVFTTLPVLAEDYSGSQFLLRDPFLTLVGGYASSSNFVLYSQTGDDIESGYSIGGTFTTRSGTESYAHFTSPVITATAGDAEVDLSWTASQVFFGGVVSSYSVGVSAVMGGPYTYTSVGTSTSTTVTSLTNGTPYYFVIKVTDANLNQNTYSAEATATPVAAAVVTPGGGGGGGGGSPTPSEESDESRVTFAGRAYPRAEVTLLQDGAIAATTTADADADFNLELEGLSEGSYHFTVFAEDGEGRRSAPLSYEVEVSTGAVTSLTGIFIAPTLTLDKSQVKQGDALTLTGQTVPSSSLTFLVDGAGEMVAQVIAGADGHYVYSLNTANLGMGDYTVQVKSTYREEESPFGAVSLFSVTTRNVPVEQEDYLRADLNHDGRVNLVDFAIAGFWYQRALSPAFAAEEIKYLNGDGKIDLTDFAIMAYYWTG